MNNDEIGKAFENRFRFKMAGKPYTEELKALCRDFFEAGVICSSPEERAAQRLQERTEKFREEVMSFTQYPQELLEDFFSYWSEPNKSKTKMLKELKKTWDTKRRLSTWARNDYNHYYGGNNKAAQRMGKLASLLTNE